MTTLVMPDAWTARVEQQSNGCLLFTGSIKDNGYGLFWDAEQGKTVLAHRYHWIKANGPIPKGLVLDHLCRNRACVELTHLELVSVGENVRRGLRGVLLSSCPAGHPYDESNTRIKISKQGWRNRVCRTCARDYARRTYNPRTRT